MNAVQNWFNRAQDKTGQTHSKRLRAGNYGWITNLLRRIKSYLPVLVWNPLRLAFKARWWSVHPRLLLERLRYLRIPEAARGIEIDYSLAVPLGFPVDPSPSGRLAAIVHLYYENLASEIRTYLEEIPFPLDVYVSARNEASKSVIEQAFAGWQRGSVVVRIVPNRGRDIAPKLLTFRDVYDRYSHVLYLHGKQSPHLSAIAPWRYYLLESLCGSADIVKSIMVIFEQCPEIGMIAAQHFEPIRHRINWSSNFKMAQKLARQMGFQLEPGAPLDFPSGSMFWARPASLKPLLDLHLSLDMFSEEEGQPDGTLAHAIERLFFYVCEYAGYNWIKIARPEIMPCTPSILTLHKLSDSNIFLKQHVFHLLNPGDIRPRAQRLSAIAQPCTKLDDIVRDRFNPQTVVPPSIGGSDGESDAKPSKSSDDGGGTMIREPYT
jgi:hypothetical protein